MYETILVDVEDDVATITLNRPDRLNAWTGQMHHELDEAISACNDDPAVGAMVVTGAGRGFCAGADIRDNFSSEGKPLAHPQAEGSKNRLQGEERQTSSNWIDLVRSSKPIIAAVNGPAVGVGVTMMLPMDVIIASKQAKFGLAFVKMGVTPELASSHFLVQRVGFGRASEMCLTGRLYDGAEAFALGLADRLAEHDDLIAEARALAREMAANPSPHLRWVKELLTKNGSETDIAEVQRREGEELAKAFASAEHAEAVDAFLNKRAPVFKRTIGKTVPASEILKARDADRR